MVVVHLEGVAKLTIVRIADTMYVGDLWNAIVDTLKLNIAPHELVVKTPDASGDDLKEGLATLVSVLRCNKDGHLAVHVMAPRKGEKRPRQELHSLDAKFTLDTVPTPEPDPEIIFTAPENWLADLAGEVQIEMEKQDSDRTRTQPIAVVRCSRGGKSRALKELAQALRRVGIPVLFVTFNDYSSISRGAPEQNDPLGALLTRIAFIATHEPPYTALQFYTFQQNWRASKAAIVEWIGVNTKCVLIIDEVNRLERLAEANAVAVDFWDFVKTVFLAPKDRMLVFSSHVVTTTTLVENYFETAKSGRQVKLRTLPFIPNWEAAKKLLRSAQKSMTRQQALYYGLIPALMVCCDELPDVPDPGELGETFDVRKLLASFFNGSSKDIPEALLPFFDTFFGHAAQKKSVKWIMCFLVPLLRALASHYYYESNNEELRWAMRALYQPLERFVGINNKDTEAGGGGGGDGWEMLFAFTFLLRAFLGRNDNTFLLETKTPCSISLNHIDDASNSFSSSSSSAAFSSVSLEECANFSALKDIIVCPNKGDVSFPHLAYYIPTHASFELYDAIACLFERQQQREPSVTLGFQLKQRRKGGIDDVIEGPAADKRLNASYCVVRDKPTSTSSSSCSTSCSSSCSSCLPCSRSASPSTSCSSSSRVSVNGWRVVSGDEMADFFGVSGEQWIPANLDRLFEEERKQ